MIIHDHALFHGWGIMLHSAGSAMLNAQSIIPALFSAALAALVANLDVVQDWISDRVVNGSVVFSGIQFLVSLIVVNRVREASVRFIVTQESYGRLNYALQRLALFFTCAVNDSSNADRFPDELQRFRIRFLRWIRAVHVLALEEFQGFETPKYRMGTLLFTEEILLFRESRRAARVIRWLSRGYTKHRALLAPSIPTDIKMQALIDEVMQAYGATLVVSNGIYPFPLAQTSFLSVVIYALWSPLAFGILLPHSYFLAPLLCFTSVWISFGSNLAAQLLEWPFDGKENDLPLKYYSVRFVKEMGELEFGVDVPLVNLPFSRLIPATSEVMVGGDYAIPKERSSLGGYNNTQDWLQRAARDMELGLQTRKRLRHKLRSTKTSSEAKAFTYDTGISMSEIRAKGEFKVLL